MSSEQGWIMHFSVSTPPFQDEMDMLIIDVLVINTQVTSHSNNIYLHCLGIKVVMFLIFMVRSYSPTSYFTTLIPTLVPSYYILPQKHIILNMDLKYYIDNWLIF